MMRDLQDCFSYSLISVIGVQDKNQPSEVGYVWTPRKVLPCDSPGDHDIDPVGLFLPPLRKRGRFQASGKGERGGQTQLRTHEEKIIFPIVPSRKIYSTGG